jgi:hypothetical protein
MDLMFSLIEIDDGFFVNPFNVTVVKAADKKQCVLYVSGQSALDGFVIKRSALEVATDIVEEIREVDESDSEEEEPETDN